MSTGARRAYAGLLVSVLAAGCGRSIRNDDGAGSGETGGTSTGGAGTATGGAGTPTSGRGGSSGVAMGGSSGSDGGTGGAQSCGETCLFYTSDGTLFGTDLDATLHVELCPRKPLPGGYLLITQDDDRVVFFYKHSVTPFQGDVVRVALDGSECTTVFTAPGMDAPVRVGERLVFTIPPTAASAELEAPEPPQRDAEVLGGLASIRMDGGGYALLSPRGASRMQILGERVVFTQAGVGGASLVSMLPDATEPLELVPPTGPMWIAGISAGRIVVNVDNDDVFAVNDDGSGFTELLGGAQADMAVGVLGNQVFIRRGPDNGADLYALNIDGGALVPLATSEAGEEFRGASDGRVVYESGTYDLGGNLYSVALDGSDVRAIAASPDAREYLLQIEGGRVYVSSTTVEGETARAEILSTALDGSDRISLHDDASFAALIGDRAILYAGGLDMDIVSVPLTGGEPAVLTESEREEWLYGRLGSNLIVHAGTYGVEGDLLRFAVDGSSSNLLAPSAMYVGAVTAACGAVPAGEYALAWCSED